MIGVLPKREGEKTYVVQELPDGMLTMRSLVSLEVAIDELMLASEVTSKVADLVGRHRQAVDISLARHLPLPEQVQHHRHQRSSPPGEHAHRPSPLLEQLHLTLKPAVLDARPDGRTPATGVVLVAVRDDGRRARRGRVGRDRELDLAKGGWFTRRSRADAASVGRAGDKRGREADVGLGAGMGGCSSEGVSTTGFGLLGSHSFEVGGEDGHSRRKGEEGTDRKERRKGKKEARFDSIRGRRRYQRAIGRVSRGGNSSQGCDVGSSGCRRGRR
jgi:hypothetical protein